MPKWIRVRDTQTGHTFDIDARVLPHRRGVEPVNDPERWPDIEGPRAQPRPAKPFVGKDGKARSAAPAGTDTNLSDTPTLPGGSDTDRPQTDTDQPVSRRRTKTSIPADMPADSNKENQR